MIREDGGITISPPFLVPARLAVVTILPGQPLLPRLPAALREHRKHTFHLLAIVSRFLKLHCV